MFIPDAIFYEKETENYQLGRELLKRYQNQNIEPLNLWLYHPYLILL